MNKFLCFGKDCYAINLDKIIDYCLNDDKDTVKETEINEGYEIGEQGDIMLSSKVVRDLRGTTNPHRMSVRYDLINLLLSELISMKTEDGINPGTSIVLNTFIERGFIYKVE